MAKVRLQQKTIYKSLDMKRISGVMLPDVISYLQEIQDEFSGADVYLYDGTERDYYDDTVWKLEITAFRMETEEEAQERVRADRRRAAERRKQLKEAAASAAKEAREAMEKAQRDDLAKRSPEERKALYEALKGEFEG